MLCAPGTCRSGKPGCSMPPGSGACRPARPVARRGYRPEPSTTLWPGPKPRWSGGQRDPWAAGQPGGACSQHCRCQGRGARSGRPVAAGGLGALGCSSVRWRGQPPGQGSPGPLGVRPLGPTAPGGFPECRPTAGSPDPAVVGPGCPRGRARPVGVAPWGGVQLWASWEVSARLVAPPGEGKTFRVLVPVLRQHAGPAVATSTKADLYELSACARERVGPVLALDPDGLAPAAAPLRWSPVSGCEQSVVAERRAAALVAATGEDGDAQNGAFFRDSARDLLKAYLHAAALEGLDIRAVLEWSRRPDDQAPAEILARSARAAPGWADLVALHTTGAAETTSGVLRYVGRALACFSHEPVVAACCPRSGQEIDIEAFLLANGTVYLLGKGSRLGAVAPL